MSWVEWNLLDFSDLTRDLTLVFSDLTRDRKKIENQFELDSSRALVH